MRSHLIIALAGLSALLTSASPHSNLGRDVSVVSDGEARLGGTDQTSSSSISLSSATTSTTETPVSTAAAQVNPDIEHALQIVQVAQLQMAKNNTNRFENIRTNNYYYKPKGERIATKANVMSNGNMVPPAAVPPRVATAAAVVAEYLASSDNSTSSEDLSKRQSGGSFWMESITHSGAPPVSPVPGYKTYRNVKDYGAKGDGKTDDTKAINKAISDGNRCGEACGSSTISPALIYFPAGTYLISSPIISYYNSQLIGNANNRPIIKASKAFVGLGAISSDVYIEGGNGAEWYINQNNFLRQVRNFVIDITDVPNIMVDPKTHNGLDAKPCAIHWQVAQATSLQNIKMIMSPAADSTHVGIFMENGSGGWMSDLEFQAGNIGAIFGNQQFTMRGLKFRKCRTAIKMLWDWGFTMSNFDIQGSNTGIEILGGTGGKDGTFGQGIGSLMLIDSTISDTPIGIMGTFANTYTQLVLENIKFNNVGTGVKSDTGSAFLPGGTRTIASYVSGKMYVDPLQRDGNNAVRNTVAPTYPASLRGSNGWYFRTKPQYENEPVSKFWDVKARSGAKGDGRSDDTGALNKAFAEATKAGMIVYIPYGVYVVTDTVTIPNGARVVGELWPQIMGSGAKFSDILSPRVVVKVGNPDDVGSVEVQELMFTVRGGTAGAILLQWNIKADKQGSAAMWDTHIRVGGAIASSLQAANCPKLTGKINEKCIAASLLVHLPPKSSGYFENVWAWTGDHDMDLVAQTQIDVYSGRGWLIESQGPTWLWGTASEHNVLYQYQLQGAKDVWMGMIQTESPYYQGLMTRNDGLEPFTIERGAAWSGDPLFTFCSNRAECMMSWAVRILNSQSVWIYGAGLYSWFQKYSQACLNGEKCQDYLVDLDDRSSKNIWLFNIATKGAQQMITPVVGFPAMAMDNKNGYTSSVMGYVTSGKDYISQWVNFGARMGKKI